MFGSRVRAVCAAAFALREWGSTLLGRRASERRCHERSRRGSVPFFREQKGTEP
jgi:hypothetical protein